MLSYLELSMIIKIICIRLNKYNQASQMAFPIIRKLLMIKLYSIRQDKSSTSRCPYLIFLIH